MDQINADPKGNCYRLAWKKIDQQIVHGSECWKYDWTKGKQAVWRMEEELEKDVVADFIQLT
jgi:hypothetical protein